MHSSSPVTAYTRSLVAGVIFWCGVPVVVCAGDDYLSILEAEADNTGSASHVTVEELRHDMTEKTGIGNNKLVTPGLSFDEFEAVLDSQYSGSHFLYIRLSRHDRQKVYRVYQNDNRISSVREEIVRLLAAG